jgi:ribosomal protein S18 acetylase RimI-like enzyme
VNREYRRGGIATRLLRETMARMSADFIKVLNIPSDDTSLYRFLADKNINLMNRQFEMVLPF